MLKISTDPFRIQGIGSPSPDPIDLDAMQKEMAAEKQKMIDEIVEIMTQDVNQQADSIKKRGQHPKAQGCLYAEFCVEQNILDQLPEGLDVGILSQAKTYPSWIRFSNLRQTNDAKGDIHGMAIKLMEVEGPQLQGSEGSTQDFVMIDVPVFFIKGMRAYRDMFRAIASLKKFFRMKKEPIGFRHFFSRLSTLGRTTHQFRQFLMPSVRPSRWRFRSVGILVRNMREKKRHKPSTLLDQQFWSPTPMKWGDRVVKISVKPWRMNQSPPIKFGPDYLKDQLFNRLTVQRKEAVFDVMLQVASDETIIDDPTVEWDNAEPFKIATLRIPPQVFDEADQKSFSEQLSFSPWHGLTTHEPLGELNEIRREVYQKTAELRTAKQEQTLPEHFQPSLLEPAEVCKQTALTVFDSIKTDRIEDLRDALKKFNDANGFGRSPLTHFARFVIFEDPEIKLKPQLLFSSNFDGDLEPYLQELIQEMGPELDAVFRCCESYSALTSLDFEQFRRYILERSNPSQAFYVACRDVSVQDILNSRDLRQTLVQDHELKAEFIKLKPFTPALPIPKSTTPKFAGLIRASRWLGRKVWSLIGVHPAENDPSQREEASPFAQDRMQQCDQSEDPIHSVQNQLSTLSVIKSDFHLFMLKMVLGLVNTVGQLSRGTLSGIGTIHFARWVILEKGRIDDKRAFLFFESNYGDTWDNYLDDFVYLTITAMNSIWANLVKYPSQGCQDIELFKRHSKSRQFPAQVFYSAYPDLTVKNIIGDRKLAQAFGLIGEFIQGQYCVLQEITDHPFMNFVKRVNRME